MPFDFKAYDAKCRGLTPEELQREWQHYTRLISGASASTAVSGLAIPLTCGVSVIGVGMAAPAIHNARKKREIIDRHLQRHQTAHQTRKRDVLGSMAFSGTIGVVTLGVGTMDADAVAANGAEHGISAIVANETAIKVVTHAALDGAGMAVEHKHTSHVKKKEALKAFTATGVFKAVEEAKAKEAGYAIEPYNPQAYGESISSQQGQQYPTYADPNWVHPPPSYTVSMTQPVAATNSEAPVPVQDQTQYSAQPGTQPQTFNYGPPEAPAPSQQKQYTYPGSTATNPYGHLFLSLAQEPDHPQPLQSTGPHTGYPAQAKPEANAAYDMQAMGKALPAPVPTVQGTHSGFPAWSTQAQFAARGHARSISKKSVGEAAPRQMQKSVPGNSNVAINGPSSETHERCGLQSPPVQQSPGSEHPAQSQTEASALSPREVVQQSAAQPSTQSAPVPEPFQQLPRDPYQPSYHQATPAAIHFRGKGCPSPGIMAAVTDQQPPLQPQQARPQCTVPPQPAPRQHVHMMRLQQSVYVPAAEPTYESQAVLAQSQNTEKFQYTAASLHTQEADEAKCVAPQQSAHQYTVPVQSQPMVTNQYPVPAQPSYAQQPVPIKPQQTGNSQYTPSRFSYQQPPAAIQPQKTGHSQHTPEQPQQQAPTLKPQQTGSSTYSTQTASTTLSTTLSWNGSSYASTPSYQVSPATTGTSVASGCQPLQNKPPMIFPPPPPGPPPVSSATAARRESYHCAQGQYGYQAAASQPQGGFATYQAQYKQAQTQPQQQAQSQPQYQPQVTPQAPHNQYLQQHHVPAHPQQQYQQQWCQQTKPVQQPQHVPQPQYQQPAYQQSSQRYTYSQQTASAPYGPSGHAPAVSQHSAANNQAPMIVSVQGTYTYQQQWTSTAAPPAPGAHPPPTTGGTGTTAMAMTAGKSHPSTGETLGAMFG